MRPSIALFVLIAASAALASCNKPPAANQDARSFGIPVSDQPSASCVQGSTDPANLAACKKEGDANFNKFLGKGGGS